MFAVYKCSQTLKHTLMKKFLIAGIIVAFLFINVFDATARKTSQYCSSLVSNKGYWVLKYAGTNAKQVTVLYFNNTNELIRKETRLKRNADLTRKKVLRSLKRSLEEAVEWAQPI